MSVGVSRPLVLVVTLAHHVGRRAQQALGHAFEVLPVADVRAAADVIAGRTLAALLLEPEDACHRPTAGLVALARTRRRGVPVAALVRRTVGWTPATLALLDTGPSTVLVVEDLDLRSVVAALAMRVHQGALVDSVWPLLEGEIPPGLRPVVRAVLARATERLTVPAAAVQLGLHRKTLWSRCRRHGLTGVQSLVTWCRLIAVGHALRTRAGTVEAIAHELAFASPAALHNAMRRYLGLTAMEVRQGGGEELVCRAFARWLRRAEASVAPGTIAKRGRGAAGARPMTAGDAA